MSTCASSSSLRSASIQAWLMGSRIGGFHTHQCQAALNANARTPGCGSTMPAVRTLANSERFTSIPDPGICMRVTNACMTDCRVRSVPDRYASKISSHPDPSSKSWRIDQNAASRQALTGSSKCSIRVGTAEWIIAPPNPSRPYSRTRGSSLPAALSNKAA